MNLIFNPQSERDLIYAAECRIFNLHYLKLLLNRIWVYFNQAKNNFTVIWFNANLNAHFLFCFIFKEGLLLSCRSVANSSFNLIWSTSKSGDLVLKLEAESFLVPCGIAKLFRHDGKLFFFPWENQIFAWIGDLGFANHVTFKTGKLPFESRQLSNSSVVELLLVFFFPGRISLKEVRAHRLHGS